MASRMDLGGPLHLASEAQLIASVGARRPLLERRLALKELIGRKVKRAAPILRRIARSAAAPAELRMTAAIAMGRDPDPANRRALEAALAAPDDEVVRRAAEALGRIGDRKALAALAETTVPGAPAAARALGFARSLISYRLGLGTELIGRQGAPAKLNAKRATPLGIAPIGRKAVAEAKARLPQELPGLAIRAEGGVALTCGRTDLLVLPNAAPAKAMRGNFVPAVVLRRADSLGHFALHLYILATPAGGGRFTLHGARPDGSIAYAGSAWGEGERLAFRLEALDAALAQPFLMEGALDPKGAALEVTTARTAPAKQARALVPRRTG